LRFYVEQPSLVGPINRLTYGLLVAAVLLSSTLLWGMAAPPLLWGISIFGFLGVVLGLVLGAHLLFLIWRSSL
jgi:ubiquinone biosynthesis protein